MLIKPELEKLLPHVDNRYMLAILIAKRVRQLLNGALPLTESESHNLVSVASKELAEGKISFVKGSVNPYVPLRPEVEAARLAARAAAEQADLADAVKDALDQAAGIESNTDTGADDARIISESLITVAEDTAEQEDEQIAIADDDEVDAADEYGSEEDIAEEESSEEESSEEDIAESGVSQKQLSESEQDNGEEPDVEDNN